MKSPDLAQRLREIARTAHQQTNDYSTWRNSRFFELDEAAAALDEHHTRIRELEAERDDLRDTAANYWADISVLRTRLAAAERVVEAARKLLMDTPLGVPSARVLSQAFVAYDAADLNTERCGWEWTDDIAQRRCDLPKGHTSGQHEWHSQRIDTADARSGVEK